MVALVVLRIVFALRPFVPAALRTFWGFATMIPIYFLFWALTFIVFTAPGLAYDVH
jgi:hypothetical protein